MTQDQFIIGIQSANRITNNKKIQYFIAITNQFLYYITSNNIQLKSKLQSIQTITISASSNQIIIHNFTDDQPWLQSLARTRILKNFLHAKEKFLKNREPFPVNIQLNKSLESALPKIKNKAKKVLKSLFKIGNNDSSTINDFKMRESDTFHIINVKQKDFKLKIGAKIYQTLYKNIKLLYTSGSLGFRFDEQKYNIEFQEPNKIIYQEKISQKIQNSPLKLKRKITLNKSQDQIPQKGQRILLRRINKGNQNVDQCISEMLLTYKSPQYKQQILFAIQTETHFQIITKYENNVKEMMSFDDPINQMDIKSIFHRVISLIQGKTASDSKDNNNKEAKSSQIIVQNEFQLKRQKSNQQFQIHKQLQNNNLKFQHSLSMTSLNGYQSRILYSLSPQNIFFDQHRKITISEIFSSIEKFRVLQYLAPQQFFEDVQEFSSTQIQLINLWKAGILIYEIAYGNTPFNIDYLADCIKNDKDIFVSFPRRDRRSTAFQNLIRSILVKDPHKRGGLGNQSWKTKVLKHKWMS